MTYSLKISRAAGGDLELMNPPTMEVIGRLDIGESEAVLEEVEGPYQHGSAVIGYRLRRSNLRMQVRIKGSNLASVENSAATLVAAVRQLSYTITYVKNGVTHTWKCHPASIALVRGMDAVDAEAKTAVYALTIPRQPIPTTGAL